MKTIRFDRYGNKIGYSIIGLGGKVLDYDMEGNYGGCTRKSPFREMLYTTLATDDWRLNYERYWCSNDKKK